jgi:hypothetical protein
VRSTQSQDVGVRVDEAKAAISNAAVDELAGLTPGHWDKATGPSRVRMLTLVTLMALCGALGLAVQLVEDPREPADDSCI